MSIRIVFRLWLCMTTAVAQDGPEVSIGNIVGKDDQEVEIGNVDQEESIGNIVGVPLSGGAVLFRISWDQKILYLLEQRVKQQNPRPK